MEGIVLTQKVGEWGLRDAVITHGGRHGDPWGKGCAGGVGLQVDSDTMGVLSMLQKEPGAGEGLLTSGTYIIGGFIPATCKTQRKKIQSLF